MTVFLGIVDTPTYYGAPRDYDLVAPTALDLVATETLEAFQSWLADLACTERTAKEEAEIAHALTANGRFRAGALVVGRIHLKSWRKYLRQWQAEQEARA